MARTILIDADGNVRDLEIYSDLQNLVDKGIFEVTRPTTLSDSTTDVDGRAVLLVSTDKTLTPNLLASTLVYPHSMRARNWVAGDAFLVWEDETGLVPVPEHYGAADVRDLMEYFEKR